MSVEAANSVEPPPPPESTPPPVVDRSARRAAARDAFLAEAAGLGVEADSTEKPAETPSTEEPVEATAEDETTEAADDSDEAADTAEAEAEAEGESEEPKAAKDLAQEKRLAELQKARKRSLDEVARARAELEAERKQWQAELAPHVEALKQFQSLQSRAKYDPAAVLMSLGYSQDDLELAARQVYEHSKAAADDPKTRGSAAAAMRLRQLENTFETYQEERRREIAELRDQLAQRDNAAQAEAWIESATKAATDDTPLVKTMLAKNPARARTLLAQVADELVAATGEVPDHSDVVTELENRRRTELEELGIEIPSAVKAATPKTKTPTAGETKTAPTKTLSPDLGTPTKPRSARMTREERRLEIVQALESGRTD